MLVEIVLEVPDPKKFAMDYDKSALPLINIAAELDYVYGEDHSAQVLNIREVN